VLVWSDFCFVITYSHNYAALPKEDTRILSGREMVGCKHPYGTGLIVAETRTATVFASQCDFGVNPEA
jgi:hypothetical protein